MRALLVDAADGSGSKAEQMEVMEAGPAAAGRHVLAVDDDDEALAGLRAVLAGAGFAVDCVAGLPEARAALAKDAYDLVLTDLYLGEETLGYEIAEVARACRPSVPVILVTGRPSLANAHEAIRSRVWQIVVKPVDGDALIAACRRAIDESAIRRRSEALGAQVRILEEVLPRCIEANDPMTAGHSERVVSYADTLARACRLDDADRESLRLASLLHDVGKIGIPRRILTKEGPLNPAERQVIQRHPTLGFEILAPLRGCEDVRRWVYQHHERWDGRGYPEGLAREEVALAGRILVLAEVFDALRSSRSYKPAWEIARIVAFFRDQAGRQFDPDLAHLVADGLEKKGPRFFANRSDALF